MSQQSVRNKHLKQTIDHAKVYLDDGEDIPVELFFNLVNELKVSNLIIPLCEDSDGITFENVNFEEDDLTFMPLFTDINEYDAYIEKDSEFNPVTFDFSQYVDLVKESELDGIIINIEGKHLPLENDLLENIYFERDIADESDVEAYTASELKDISQNVSNDSLVELLTSDGKITNDQLFAELSNSVMLNVIVSDEPLDEFATDGIIKADDVDGFTLCNVENGDILLGGIFTDLDSVKAVTADLDTNCYVQVTNLAEMFDFALRNDMDGVIINANTLDCIILREDILSQASGIEIIVENPKFRNCLDYAFMI